MHCQILFSRKNKKNIISLLSAEFAHSMVSDNVLLYCREILEYCIYPKCSDRQP